MRIARFTRRNKTSWGIIRDDLIYSLLKPPFKSFEDGTDYEFDGKSYPLTSVKLMAPCLPSKIVCLGVNYRPHAEEFNSKLPSNPLIFIKPSTAVIGPEDSIILPRNFKRVDFEGELALVIGKRARFVSEEESREYLLGYTCFNDVTERDIQKADGQWTRAKGFDTFAPIGPWIETEVLTEDLKIETYLNGERRQNDRTSSLIFGISTLVSFISNVMTLLPGDVIATGTPAGVGPMKAGDVVEVRIEKIGSLRNAVASPI